MDHLVLVLVLVLVRWDMPLISAQWTHPAAAAGGGGGYCS